MTFVFRLTPHPGRSEAMLICGGNCSKAIAPILIGSSTINWVNKTRLLGMIMDENLSWVPHTLELKKSFAKKLSLPERSRFLPRNILQDFYFKVILLSVNHGLVLWGACCNSEILYSFERPDRILFNLTKDMASAEVLKRSKWLTINFHYKFAVFKLIHKACNDRLPAILSSCITKRRDQ